MKHKFLIGFVLLFSIATTQAQVFPRRNLASGYSFADTLNGIAKHSRYQIEAKRIGFETIENRPYTVFEVTELVSGPDGDLKKGSHVRVWEPETFTIAGGTPLSKSDVAEMRRLGSAAIIVSQDTMCGRSAAVLMEAREPLITYLRDTSTALASLDHDAKRIAVFLPYLTSMDPVIAVDALGEVTTACYQGLIDVRDQLPRDFILKKLADPQTPMIQLGQFGLLAGICGKPEDAVFLKSRLRIVDAEYQDRVEALMAGYLLLTGEPGLAELEETRFRSKTILTTFGDEIVLPFHQMYALVQAVRFLWEIESDRFGRERLLESMRLLLERHEVADLIIIDLARWKDWSVQDRLVEIYNDDSHEIPAIRRAIVRYLLLSSHEEGLVSADGTKHRPEHAIKADAYLKQIQAKDAMIVEHLRRLLEPR